MVFKTNDFVRELPDGKQGHRISKGIILSGVPFFTRNSIKYAKKFLTTGQELSVEVN